MNLPTSPWSLTVDELFKALDSAEQGLTEQQAQERQQRIGRNELPPPADHGPLPLFLKQLKDPMIYVLFGAGAITFLLREWIESIVIACAILANASMGFWQEWKAQSILDALKNYIVVKTRVKRKGLEQWREAKDLVPGDIVVLKAGDRVPADIRLINLQDLKIDEAILTGESTPVEKALEIISPDSAIHSRTNIALSGTLVVEGAGEGIVVATGAQTAFGSIAALTASSAITSTPLQRSVEKLSLNIGILALFITLGVFGIGLSTGASWHEMLLLALAIGVSLVPEGLPIAMSVILAIGVERLAKKKGIIRKLSAAEALGSTTVILTDKTGTLTQASLSLSKVYSQDPERAFQYAVIASQASIENPEQSPDRWRMMGSPIDTALLRAAHQEHYPIATWLKQTTIIERKPFSHATKYSASLVDYQGNKQLLFIGAPDRLTELCSNGPSQEEIQKLASTGSRLIGIASDVAISNTIQDPSSTCTYIGTFAFEDPLRPNIPETVASILQSGVRTVMVTGDHPQTAASIAKRIGITSDKAVVLHGDELRNMTDEQLIEYLPYTHAFARVTPEQKWRLVKAYQSQGELVAVTGDGVNDAPALRIAEVGVAMGSGTDVAKEAADIVILDDSYSTIVTAIHEGRRILNNIQKAATYLFSNAFNDLVMVLGSFALGIPSPLNALQILYANFFTDSFPAIGYAFETLEDQGTSAKHSLHEKDLLGKRLKLITLISAVLNGITLLTGYVFARNLFDDATARTIGFASMGLSHIFVAIAYRSLYLPMMRYGLKGNNVFLAGLGIGVILITSAIYLPILNVALDTVPLSFSACLYFICIAFIASLPAEISKLLIKSEKEKRLS